MSGGGKGLNGNRSPGKRDLNSEMRAPELRRLDLHSIDRSNELFSTNFEPNLERLRASIGQVGILAPIWVKETKQRLHIINGFRRFDIARSLGQTEIPSLLWGERQLLDRSAFQMSLHENTLTRGLNPVEKAIALQKLLNTFSIDRDETLSSYLPLLDLNPNEKILDTLLTVNGFSVATKRYLLDHEVGLANVSQLATFSKEDRESICRFLSPLKVGGNVLREMLTFIREISQRDGLKIEDLLSTREIEAVTTNPHLSGPQLIQGIRTVLREKRYPRLSELEKGFEDWKGEVRLSPAVAFSPPPFFEGDRFKVEGRFETVEQYRSLVEELQKLSEKGIDALLRVKGYGRDRD
jgi:hypothetical protein